jgi:hypothetical protein
MREAAGKGCGCTVALLLIAGWLTHLAVCFNEDKWGFLIAGAIFFPVGIIHGIGRWFGLW